MNVGEQDSHSSSNWLYPRLEKKGYKKRHCNSHSPPQQPNFRSSSTKVRFFLIPITKSHTNNLQTVQKILQLLRTKRTPPSASPF